MDIITISKSSALTASKTTNLNNSDLCTIAMNNVLFNDDDKINLYVTMRAQGASSTITGAQEQGGCGTAVEEFNPGFYPFATAGSQCAALVQSLDWANDNLVNDYEYIRLGSSTSTTGYLVSGTLTSTKTEFNDPFDETAGIGFIKGACWSAAHSIGLNPF